MEKSEISITNEYLDTLIDLQTGRLNAHVRELMEMKIPAKPLYWLTKAFDQLLKEATLYLKTKRNLALRFAEIQESDGEEKDSTEKVIRRWKKGDPESDPTGNIIWKDRDAWLKELEELRKIVISIPINRIDLSLDELPSLSMLQMKILIPLIKNQK